MTHEELLQMVNGTSRRANGAPARRVGLGLKVQRRWMVAGLLALDVLALVAGFAAAYAIRFYTDLPVFRDVVPSLVRYLPLAAGMVALWLILFLQAGLYDEHNLLGGTREYALVFQACTVGTAIAVLANFLVEKFVVSRGLVLLNWFFTFLLAGGARFWYRRWIYALRRRGYFLSPTLIVGANQEGIALAQQLDLWAASGMRLVGFVDGERSAGSPIHNGLLVLGGYEALPQLVDEQGIEELVIASAGVPRERMMEIVRRYGSSPDIDIHFSTGVFEILTTGVKIRERAYVPLISLNKVRLTGIDVFLKGVVDIVGGVVGVVLLWPVLAGIALWIRLDSPGPALYRRRVLGLHGRPFDAFKFRTMKVDWEKTIDSAEVRDQFVVGAKPKKDPRVTRAGRILRRLSLDELPQVLNVLARQMSIVGPRMITQQEMPLYGKWGMNLLTLRPGMTGLWQVSGRADLTYEDKVELDMYYIRNYSIWLDLQLVVRTVSVVLRGKGAR